jgi:hypothetical protein
MGSGLSRKARYLSGIVAATVAVATSGVMVFTSSSAAFSATTSNPGNTWTTGAAPTLTDDDASDTMMFNVANLGPGDTGQRCIAVTSTSSNPTRDLRFYSTRADSDTLGTQLTIKVERGTGGTFANCTGFSSAATIVNTTLDQVPATYAASTGTSVTVASGTATTVYRITYSLPANLSSTYASRTTQATFTWEIR